MYGAPHGQTKLGQDRAAVSLDPQIRSLLACSDGQYASVPTRQYAGAEPGANLVGPRVAQVVQDVQGLLPGLAGSKRLTASIVAVAKMDEGLDLIKAVALLSGEGKGLLVADDGLGVRPEVVASVAHAVPGIRLTVPVAEFLVQRQGLLAAGQGLLVVTQLGVAPADVVEGRGLPVPVADGPAQLTAPAHGRSAHSRPGRSPARS